MMALNAGSEMIPKKDRSYSKNQVNKAGENLKKYKEIKSENELNQILDILSYWRFSHEVALEGAFELIQKIAKKVDRNAIFAKRLKRIPSIKTKLERFEKMQLKNVHDIGGCRVVLSSEKKLRQVLRELKKNVEFKIRAGQVKIKDYIRDPKEDGYRSVHITGQFINENKEKKHIEIQLRTQTQHYWATALEIIDLFTNQSLKTNQGKTEWKEFFTLVSEQFFLMDRVHMFSNLPEQDQYNSYVLELEKASKQRASEQVIMNCQKISKIERKLEVLKKLNAFAGSIEAIDERLEENGFNGYVLLVIYLEEGKVSSTFFNDSQNAEAETAYIESEKRTASDDVIVALVYSSSVGGIKQAYPNFFADSSQFLLRLNYILSVDIELKGSLFEKILRIRKMKKN